MNRRVHRLGKYEREARKRHRRAWIVRVGCVLHANHAYFLRYPVPEAVPLKLGRKHYQRWVRGGLMVVDSRNVGEQRALESACRSVPNS